MTPVHHLDDATLVSYSAGALMTATRVVVATHLDACAVCRRRLLLADQVGGVLLQRQEADEVGARARKAMQARLDAEPASGPEPGAMPVQHPRRQDPDRLPEVLHRYFGTSYSGLRWRTLVPGMRRIRARGVSGGDLILLSIAPGKSMPMHGHQGNELTQVLKGAYDDDLGHFGPGDVADLDCDVEHQPVTAAGEPCICLAALDAPLRFPGRIARLLQPVFGF